MALAQPNQPTTIADAAVTARSLLDEGASNVDLWRHVVLQTLDDYESDLRLHGVDVARTALIAAPPLTGDSRIDAALAALTEHLARRDTWDVPAWTQAPERTTMHWWFIDEQPGLRTLALRESPLSFRKRGVFIGHGALDRV